MRLVKDKYGDSDPTPKVYCKSCWADYDLYSKSINSARQKNVTLSFMDRMVVVDPFSLPEKIKKDLDGPICGWDGTPLKV